MLGTELIRCTERERENGRSGASLLHACVTNFAAGSRDKDSDGAGAAQLKALASDRLSIAAVSPSCLLACVVGCFPLIVAVVCVVF